jgi:hypothetical protein
MNRIDDNECGCCSGYHRIGYTGDCRNDAERFTLDDVEREGRERWDAEKKRWDAEKKMKSDLSGKWLIWSIEHDKWWAFNSHGYTSARDDAGRYEFDEACRIVSDANMYCRDTPNEAMVREQR